MDKEQKTIGQVLDPDTYEEQLQEPKAWIKPTYPFTFQLQDEDVEEKYQVYRKSENKYYNETERITDVNGKEWDVKFTKFIGADNFKATFGEDTNKVTTFERPIIVDGENKVLGFKKTQNDALIDKIKTIVEMDGNSIEKTYMIVKGKKDESKGDDFNNIKYSIELVKTQPSVEPKKDERVITLADGEKEFIKNFKEGTLKKMDPESNKLSDELVPKTKEDFIAEYTSRTSEEERASLLWQSEMVE